MFLCFIDSLSQKYEDMAETDKERYKQEMAKYQLGQVEDGEGEIELEGEQEGEGQMLEEGISGLLQGQTSRDHQISPSLLELHQT